MLENLKPVQQAALAQLRQFTQGRELDQLEKYCAGFLSQSTVLGFVPFANAVWMVENVTSILLDRRGQFQVQLFAVPGGTVIPEHTHPNVDSFEVYVGGSIHFSHSGKYSYPAEALQAVGSAALASKRGLLIRVRPNDLHGGVFGEGGGVFMSIQHWLNGVKPHCVASDYSGVTMGEHHLSKVVNGKARAKKQLTAKDAAHLEH